MKVELDLLHLVNDHHGDTELGTLFLERAARAGGGRGRLLSFARLMLIAADPVRFGPKAMAEIRGWTDPQGRSPFWEAVGAKFFRMDYRDADTLSARDHRFIADLMPRYPIYADLLPDEARGVIAQAAPDAQPALAMLKSQGFHSTTWWTSSTRGRASRRSRTRSIWCGAAARMPAGDFASSSTRRSEGLLACGRPRQFRRDAGGGRRGPRRHSWPRLAPAGRTR